MTTTTTILLCAVAPAALLAGLVAFIAAYQLVGGLVVRCLPSPYLNWLDAQDDDTSGWPMFLAILPFWSIRYLMPLLRWAARADRLVARRSNPRTRVPRAIVHHAHTPQAAWMARNVHPPLAQDTTEENAP